MNEEIKEKLDLNPNNMNVIAKEAYYQLENYIFALEKTQNNWNELKKLLNVRIKSYEDRQKLGKGYELTEVMKISLACDRRFLKQMQEIEEGNNDN